MMDDIPSADELRQELNECRDRVIRLRTEVSDLRAEKLRLEQQLEEIESRITAKASELREQEDVESNLYYGFMTLYGR